MKVTDIQPEQYLARKGWTTRKSKLYVGLYENILYYFENGCKKSIVGKSSSIYKWDDFYVVDKLGNKLILKEIVMKYEETTVVVLRETDGTLVPFKSDEEAQIWIAKELEKDSTQKFKVWDKPSYEVRPKKVDLSELIHKF